MSTPDQNANLIRALEALLRAPETGRAVAETLMSTGTGRRAPAAVSGPRASGARQGPETDGETQHAAQLGRGTASPWAR
jgi:hypothetical protein